jgi:flagellar motor switch protein FliN
MEDVAGTPVSKGNQGAMSAAAPTHPQLTPDQDSPSDQWPRRLPEYARSLLRIKVPVTVTLATSKQSIHSILELVPGAILQFDKLCDDTLSLEVGGRVLAVGEAVKVGDKFGLRLTSMVTPGERFQPVRPAPQGVSPHEGREAAQRDISPPGNA